MSAHVEIRRPALAVMGWVLTACGSDHSAGPRLPELRIVEPPVTAVPAPVPGGISPENDGFGFAFAVDLRVQDGELAVLENGNSRLVLFDSSFRAVGTIGSEGAGPGELRGAFSLDAAGGLLGVGEINNARISIFDTSGAFRRSVGAPGDAAFAFGSGGALFVVSGSTDHYLQRVDNEDARRPFGARPVHLYPPAVQRERVLPGAGRELVAVGVGGAVHVFDRVLAAVLTLDLDGRQTGIHQLPRQLRDDLREQQRLVYADFGDDRAVHHVAVSDLTTTDDDRLLLLFPVVDGVFGLLIDPEAGSARELQWAGGSREAAEAQGGGKGVVHRGLLYRALADEVTVYRLRDGSMRMVARVPGLGGRRTR